MKPYSDNISISEFVPVFTKRPGLNAERQTMRSVTGLSSFVGDVNAGIIWGIRGWVNNLAWSSTGYNNVTWWSGTLTLSNGSSYSITGSFVTLTTVTYIFLDTAVSVTALQTTTVAANSVWATRILVCVANLTVSGKDAQYQVFWWAGSQTFINADNIAANSITGNEVQANSITASEIDVADLFAQTITATGTITGATIIGGVIKTSAWTSTRIELESNKLSSYDSSNVRRVESANAWFRFRDDTWSYYADISGGTTTVASVPWQWIQVSDLTASSNTVWLRTKFLSAQDSLWLQLFLRWWILSFKWLWNAIGSGVQVSSPDNDTLTTSWAKFSLWGMILEKIGSDLYWNGVKIN